ncbi:hypothetical protein K505DRAFT_357163 [Melanomma pulvis-pyrius CBS 109.77]|uniref:Uncharacterized protein n=1 Tax=Melanomma pulvis-pyrius CBS 109.77 TaxID=1314802 RepID=A0A6A6XQU8_9PLEO|nr:hypothetical protein K505DRAFT_357163 [Melanomma pulvis-pyrius CBS 109.77]
MSNPSPRRLSDAPEANTGPSRSVLQQLLEEINAPDNPTALQHTRDSQGTPKPTSRFTSAWVAGSSIAQDARAKLRAADEARQWKLSMNSTYGMPADQAPLPLRRHSTQSGIQFMAPGTSIWKPPHNLSPTFYGVDFAGRSTSTAARTNSPPTGSRGNVSPRKLAHSPPDSPEPLAKRKRQNTTSDYELDGQGSHGSDLGPTMRIRGGGGPGASLELFQTPTFTERCNFVDSPIRVQSSMRPSLVAVSSFRPIADISQDDPAPATPMRNYAPPNDSTASPAYTPAWMKSFHLVDNEKSIYMNVHGEDWKVSPLCLYCFRQHGEFHRVLPDGCELCGREDVLERHYWEPANGPY